MKKMKIEEWIKQEFHTSSAPAKNTVKRWIDKGEISGCKIGCNYYVHYDKINTGNELADEILRDTAA